MYRYLLAAVLVPLAAALVMSSCASVPFSRSHARQSEVDAAIQESRSLLDNNAFAEALGILEPLYLKDKEPRVLEAYRRAAELAKGAADQAFERKDYARAGNLYHALLKSRMPIAADRLVLERQIRECSKTLTERGLEKYREEHLAEAIAIWKKILSFDPDNRSVQKALETASRQLKSLEAMHTAESTPQTAPSR